jgi:hypothetical protein
VNQVALHHAADLSGGAEAVAYCARADVMFAFFSERSNRRLHLQISSSSIVTKGPVSFKVARGIVRCYDRSQAGQDSLAG